MNKHYPTAIQYYEDRVSTLGDRYDIATYDIQNLNGVEWGLRCIIQEHTAIGTNF